MLSRIIVSTPNLDKIQPITKTIFGLTTITETKIELSLVPRCVPYAAYMITTLILSKLIDFMHVRCNGFEYKLLVLSYIKWMNTWYKTCGSKGPF